MGLGASTLISDLSEDNQLKIYRQLVHDHNELTKNGASESEIFSALSKKHKDLESLYKIKDFSCPKVRFGRTNLQMPIITCGGMR